MGHRASRVRTGSQTNRRYGMKRIGAIALVLWIGLACAMSAQAKPKHQPLRCKAGYTRGTVRIAKRVHGRIVRRHGRIVYVKVQRCVKTPKPKPSSPAPPRVGTPTTPTTPQPPGTTTTTTTAPSPSPTPSPTPPQDHVVVAVGDIARPPGCSPCRTVRDCGARTDASIPLPSSSSATTSTTSGAYSEYTGVLRPHMGAGFQLDRASRSGQPRVPHVRRGRLLPVLRRATASTGGDNPPGGYYSFNLGSWHIVALNSNCSDQRMRGRPHGGATSAEMSWLQSDLATNTSACVLAMWHHPLFSYGWTLGDPGVRRRCGTPCTTPMRTSCSMGTTTSTSATTNWIRPATRPRAGFASSWSGTGGESLNGPYGARPPATLQAQDQSSTACWC